MRYVAKLFILVNHSEPGISILVWFGWVLKSIEDNFKGVIDTWVGWKDLLFSFLTQKGSSSLTWINSDFLSISYTCLKFGGRQAERIFGPIYQEEIRA